MADEIRDEDDDGSGTAVPSGRISRLARMGGLGGRIGANMLGEGVRSLARGERPEVGKLLLTPQNVERVAGELSRLRGAAMKVGQIISMDGGDFLPPELAQLLARLREGADHMPQRQMRGVLAEAWGEGWQREFAHFEFRPLAAASIGQVHRARTRDGRDLAIKVQYPGVADSIDSDVDNVATLIRMTGLMPRGTDLGPFLEEAKRQLHDEADYHQEAAYMTRYAEHLGEEGAFAIPKPHDDLTTKTVLAMDYVPGTPIEATVGQPQGERDRILARLFDLMYRELFVFRLMQTDPNFANYRYQTDQSQIALLDFGATRDFPADFAEAYRQMLRAGVYDSPGAVLDRALDIGLLNREFLDRHKPALLPMVEIVFEPLRTEGPYDFGRSDITRRLGEADITFQERMAGPIPPTDSLYLHRKFAGMYLLATRLEARVDVRALILPYLED